MVCTEGHARALRRAPKSRWLSFLFAGRGDVLPERADHLLARPRLVRLWLRQASEPTGIEFERIQLVVAEPTRRYVEAGLRDGGGGNRTRATFRPPTADFAGWSSVSLRIRG